jgi:hypothetical protein
MEACGIPMGHTIKEDGTRDVGVVPIASASFPMDPVITVDLPRANWKVPDNWFGPMGDGMSDNSIKENPMEWGWKSDPMGPCDTRVPGIMAFPCDDDDDDDDG